MAKPYSMDLRERAMRRVAAGESAHSVAAVLKVSVSSIIKWVQRQRRTGSVAPGKMGGHRSLRVSGEHRTWLLARVAGDPHVTLRSLARELGERGITVCHGTVSIALNFDPCTHTSEIDWMLPGVKPTGRRVEIPLIAIVRFVDGKVAHEHIYWDQASVLVQVALIDPAGLPVAGIETARKAVDQTLPSNELMTRWAASSRKPI